MLRELQQDFLARIYSSGSEGILARISPTPRLTPTAQMDVYRGSVYGILTHALADTYPVCQQLVGEAFFDAMTTVFIEAYPSLSPDLNQYGEAFPSFLSQFAPVASLPYLPDVARLEWGWQQVFQGTDQPGLDMAALAQIPPTRWGEIIFQLPAAYVLLASNYPVHQIWQLHQPDAVSERANGVDLAQGGVNLLIWQQGLTMHLDPLTEIEWQLLNLIQAGQSFGEICDGLAQADPLFKIEALLSHSLQQGWIGSYRLEDRQCVEAMPTSFKN